jgi:hypothetical protein
MEKRKLVGGVLEGLLVGAALFAWTRTSVTDRDVLGLAGGRLPTTAQSDAYARYLRRHRVHRYVGGLVGVITAALLGLRADGTVHIGIGHTNPFGDVLFAALTGILVGALSAEWFRVREPVAPAPAASLAPRPGLAAPRTVAVSRVLLGAVLLVGAASGWADRNPAVVGVTLGAAVLWACAEATRVAIRDRRRTALGERALEVDRRIREFAGGAVAQLQLASGILSAAWVLALVVAPRLDGTPFFLALHLLAVFGGLALTAAALHRAAPRPPRAWQHPAEVAV